MNDHVDHEGAPSADFLVMAIRTNTSSRSEPASIGTAHFVRDGSGWFTTLCLLCSTCKSPSVAAPTDECVNCRKEGTSCKPCIKFSLVLVPFLSKSGPVKVPADSSAKKRGIWS